MTEVHKAVVVHQGPWVHQVRLEILAHLVFQETLVFLYFQEARIYQVALFRLYRRLGPVVPISNEEHNQLFVC